MTDETFKSIITRLCGERNVNAANIDYEYCVFSEKDAQKVCDFYHLYDGRQEFLYVPSLDEISGVLNKDNSVYVGVVSKNDKSILGITKVAKIENPRYSFFRAPRSVENSENTEKGFYGVSGLFIRKEAQGKKLATHLMDLSFDGLQEYNAAGIYADCDFRNIASFNTLSKRMDFVGYTDGRLGASGEKTIYVTFFNDLTQKEREEKNLVLDFSSTYTEKDSLYDWYKPVEASISEQLRQLGNVSKFMVPYGNENDDEVEFGVDCRFNGNIISVLDIPVSTKGLKLNLGKWFPEELLKVPVTNVSYNSGDDAGSGGGAACVVEKDKKKTSTKTVQVSKKKSSSVGKDKVNVQMPSLNSSVVSALLSAQEPPSHRLVRALVLDKKEGKIRNRVIGDYSWAPVSNIADQAGIAIHGAIWAPVSNIVVTADKKMKAQGLLGMCIGRLHGTSKARHIKTKLLQTQLLKVKGGGR